jgi:hypothetical protein
MSSLLGPNIFWGAQRSQILSFRRWVKAENIYTSECWDVERYDKLMCITRWWTSHEFNLSLNRVVIRLCGHIFGEMISWFGVVLWCHTVQPKREPNNTLTLILLTWTKWWASASASKWQMGFNSVFKWLIYHTLLVYHHNFMFSPILIYYFARLHCSIDQ